jgi:subtilisin-like proprotein convertase family protein
MGVVKNVLKLPGGLVCFAGVAMGASVDFNLVKAPRDPAVNFAAPLPTISPIADQWVSSGSTTKLIPFSIIDPLGRVLTVRASSSAQDVVADSSIVISPVSTAVGDRTIRFSGVGGLSSPKTAQITVAVYVDEAKVVSSFTVFLCSDCDRPLWGANIQPITIRDDSIADPYPSQIIISDVAGNLTKLVVNINGLTHRFASDIDMLLVGPDGQKVVLMSDAGGGPIGNHINLNFDAAATEAIPNSSLFSGTYRPANYESGSDVFPSPAPTGPYTNVSLAVFNGTSPNGAWSLYIVDDEGSDSGVITNGWSLVLEVNNAPEIKPLSDQVTNENVAFRVPLEIYDRDFPPQTLTLKGVASDTNLVTDITFEKTLTERFAVLHLGTNQHGVSSVIVTVSDGRVEASTVFNLTVLPANEPPVLGHILDWSVQSNIPFRLPLTVSDPDTPLTNLIFRASWSNSNLVASVNFEISGTNVTAIIQSQITCGLQVSHITISVEDGANSVSQTFDIYFSAECRTSISISRSINEVRINVGGRPYYDVGYFTSTNLLDWKLSTVTLDSEGLGTITLTNVSERASEFFKLRPWPW